MQGVESDAEHCCEKKALTVADPGTNAFTLAVSCEPADELLRRERIEVSYTYAGPIQPPFTPIPACESSKTIVSMDPA